MKKKKILFGSIVLLCAAISAPYFYPKMMKNEPDGFRGIHWNAAVLEGASSSDKSDELIGSRFGEFTSCKVYERKNEDLFIGEATIDSIFYSFQDDMGFVSATIYFRNSKNFELITKYCLEKWGKPASEKRQAEASGALDFAELSWRGKKAETTMWYSGKSKLGALHIYLKESFFTARKDFNQLLQREEPILGQVLD